MNKINSTLALALLLGMTVSLSTRAQSLQPIEEVENAAYIYGLAEAQAEYDNPQLTMEPLDSRLRLEKCSSELEAFSNTHSRGLGNQTVGVKCQSPIAWTIYVPIKVKVFQPVVVAARPLAGKHIISKADLRIKQQDITAIRQGYIQDTAQAVGQQLKYSVAQGTVINPNSLVTQKLVHRGDQIMLIAKSGAMEVKMSGIALSDATQGQRVRVKNISSDRVVEGVVDAPGIVRVMM